MHIDATVVVLILSLLHSTDCIVRRIKIDKILNSQKISLTNGTSINLQGNAVDNDILRRAVLELRGKKITPSLPGKAPKPVLRMRKEYRCLLPDERENFHRALRTLKTSKPVGANLTQYDAFISQHDHFTSPAAHFSPAFCPWHRHYIFSFEILLQRECPSCMLPFWDSRLDSRLGGNPQHSVIFSPILAGNSVGPVVTGFAANWTSPGEACSRIHPTLMRNFNEDNLSLLDDRDVRFAEGVLSHRDLSYPWNDTFEMNHGYVHAAFGDGSHMSNILCSPCDPMFLLHHSFIDNLFERARENIRRRNLSLVYTDVEDLPVDFYDSADIVRVFSAPEARMLPFEGITNSYGLLSDDYMTKYNYERSPGDVACFKDGDCCANGSAEFLWCDTDSRRCLSKVGRGGRVLAGLPERACHCPREYRPVIRSSTCECV